MPTNQSGRTLLLRRSKDDLTRMKEIENIAPKREGGGERGERLKNSYLVIMARCGGLMHAPMNSTTFSWRVFR